ncbi:MAG TPA: flagellar type III secretion system pore protein FliP [Clostridiaceae bacterium]|nr:flagellar type III secretion system pore protein FliP [Clostridiaceae bacterium]
MKRKIFFWVIVVTVALLPALNVFAEPLFPFDFLFDLNNESSETQQFSTTIQILILITILSLAPAIIIMMTSFTRVVIVLSFLRNALGTQQMPPNQVIIGIALFLTIFIMQPVYKEINEKALVPFENENINQTEALNISGDIIKKFMLEQIRSEDDLALFVSLSDIQTPVDPETLPLTIVIPAFLLNELTIAFKMGFMIYIPFLIIDMIVSSTLMSMGMMMLPPSLISLPFKVLLFILVGGWNLVVESILRSFAR